MKTAFKDYVIGHLTANGKTLDDIAQMTGTSLSTVYRKLSDPDTMSREMLRMIHKYSNISYEELMERR